MAMRVCPKADLDPCLHRGHLRAHVPPYAPFTFIYGVHGPSEYCTGMETTLIVRREVTKKEDWSSCGFGVAQRSSATTPREDARFAFRDATSDGISREMPAARYGFLSVMLVFGDRSVHQSKFQPRPLRSSRR